MPYYISKQISLGILQLQCGFIILWYLFSSYGILCIILCILLLLVLSQWKVNITVCVQILVEYFVTQKLVACMLLSLGMFISVHEMFLLNILLIFL